VSKWSSFYALHLTSFYFSVHAHKSHPRFFTFALHPSLRSATLHSCLIKAKMSNPAHKERSDPPPGRHDWHPIVSFHSNDPDGRARLLELKPLIEVHMRRLVGSLEPTDPSALDRGFAEDGGVVPEMIYDVKGRASKRPNWSEYLRRYLKAQYDIKSYWVGESYFPNEPRPATE
jgi:hypothetical protein